MPRLHEQRLVFMLAVNIHQQVCYLLQRGKVNERTIYAAYVFARSRQLTGYYQPVVLQLILPQHGLYGFLAFYIELRLYRRLFRSRGYELPACPLSQRQIYSVNNNGFSGSGLTGKHVKPIIKIHIQPLYQSDIFYRQPF